MDGGAEVAVNFESLTSQEIPRVAASEGSDDRTVPPSPQGSRDRSKPLQPNSLPDATLRPRAKLAQLAVEVERFPHVVVQQVDVRGERERGRMMPEPSLHLHGICPTFEEDARTGVPERVEASPRTPTSWATGFNVRLRRLSTLIIVPAFDGKTRWSSPPRSAFARRARSSLTRPTLSGTSRRRTSTWAAGCDPSRSRDES